MRKLGATVSLKTVAALERRAVRLASLVEAATQTSPHKAIRDGGAQLVERLSEWVEEIRDLHEVGDEEINDVVKSFHVRLWLAETKVKEWPIPEAVRKRAIHAAEPPRRGRPPGSKNKKKRAQKPKGDQAAA